MADFKPNCLPILVISARDQNSAKAIISEIIESKDPEGNSRDNNEDCVWKIVNKYYTADVRLHALLDGQELDTQLGDSVEAHLIYMSEDECMGGEAADLMRRRARAVSSAHVRVVAAAAAEAPALAGACAGARLELVPLREAPAAGDERGLARVRAALHAHLWPGLVRRGRDAESVECAREVPSDGSDDEWSEWCSGGQAAHDEQAFAAALAALPGAAAAARAAAGGGSREERLARAEDLVAAFCRALGTPLD